MAEVKCRKCKLTYDKKNKKCPYCKTARPNFGIIAAAAITVGIAAVILLSRGEILNIFPSKTKFIDGMLVQVESVSASSDLLGELLDIDEIEVEMTVSNLSPAERDLDFKIKAYTDEYEANTNWIFSESSVRVSTLLPGKKCIQTITVIPNTDDWSRLEIFYSAGNSDYRKFCVIKRRDIE